jgi:hypothetical protein
MPETPVYLYKIDKITEGDSVLKKLYKPEYVLDKKREM